jgi:hypothetical protein
MTRERERIFVTNRACHCMSLMLVASWSNGNTRMTTTSISNFAICPTAVADRRKRRQICFFEIWEESCLFSKYVCVCVKKENVVVCVYICSQKMMPSWTLHWHWLDDDRQESVLYVYVYIHRAQLFTVNYLRI